jgi:hypothetical protein
MGKPFNKEKLEANGRHDACTGCLETGEEEPWWSFLIYILLGTLCRRFLNKNQQ